MLSLCAVLFLGQVQAQAVDSISKGKIRVVVAKADSSTRQPFKPIRIVCAPSITASRGPLIVIDGKVAPEQQLKLINPNDIDKVRVLKESFATALYGSRAANGAVLITLKRGASKNLIKPKAKKDHLD